MRKVNKVKFDEKGGELDGEIEKKTREERKSKDRKQERNSTKTENVYFFITLSCDS